MTGRSGTAPGSRADPLGRDATRPREIPIRGWRHILVRVYHAFNQNFTLLVAAGVTFYLLLSMVPALTALVSIYGLFNDPAAVSQQLDFIQVWLPAGARDILSDQLGRLVGQSQHRLSLALLTSLAVALWSANAGTKALLQAMNVAYGETETRSLLRVLLVSMTFTIGGILMLLLLITVMVVLPAVLGWFDLPDASGFWLQLASTAVLALAALLALSVLYRWGPSRESARWRWITPGAVLALVGAFAASSAFGWYVSSFASYNRTYGSLGAVIGFMTWLWIMAALVVTGAELNAEMEHHTARDSTVGPDRPLGERGAVVADRVAAGPDDPVSRSAGTSLAPLPASNRASSPPTIPAHPAQAGQRQETEPWQSTGSPSSPATESEPK